MLAQPTNTVSVFDDPAHISNSAVQLFHFIQLDKRGQCFVKMILTKCGKSPAAVQITSKCYTIFHDDMTYFWCQLGMWCWKCYGACTMMRVKKISQYYLIYLGLLFYYIIFYFFINMGCTKNHHMSHINELEMVTLK